jgi:SseB protein N-terminal domain
MFTPQNELETALVRADENPAALAEFERLLLASSIYIIGQNEGAKSGDETAKLADGTAVQLAAIRRGATEFIPIFTSVERLQIYFEQSIRNSLIRRYLTMTGQAFFETAKGKPFLLNPGFDHSREIHTAEVARLLAGPTN